MATDELKQPIKRNITGCFMTIVFVSGLATLLPEELAHGKSEALTQSF